MKRPTLRPLAIFAALALAVGPFALAEDEAPTALDDSAIEAAEAVIGTITIRSREIFDLDDPSEDRPLFRLANRLHARTKESAIRSRLTFREGDRYVRARLDESERALRQAGYLYDATVRPARFDGRVVDVEVVTRDVWTLKAGGGFGRSGGTNRTHFGLHDRNFLGFGKDLEFRRTTSVDRTETLWAYEDPNLFGTRGRLVLAYSDNSDGRVERLAVERPFFSADTRWAAGLSADSSDAVAPRYALGRITDTLRRRGERLEAWAGFSRGAVGPKTRRYSIGFTRDRDRFDPILGPGDPLAQPIDRTLAYPWFGYDAIREDFLRATDVDKIGRTEDLNLGRSLHLRLGFSAPVFGADRSGAIFSARYEAGFSPGFAQMVLLSADLAGRVAGSGVEDGTAGTNLRYLRRAPSGNLFVISWTGRAATRLDPDHQILLGGDNGLRGYPLRYAVGDFSTLLTVEERFYRDREYFHLFRMGAAIFADVGRAWGGPAGPGRDLGLLRDVGVGLRFGQSRSGHGSIVKVDLAYPFDGDPAIRRAQLLVTAGDSF